MPDVERDLVAELLRDWADGDAAAYDRLFSHVYNELKRVAHNELRKESPNPLLQTTGLVHEAFLRLRSSRVDWQNKQQFYAVFARLMRQILVDFGRRRRAMKRSGKLVIPSHRQTRLPADVLDLNEALEELERLDPQKAQLVELRFFAGLSVEEVANVIGVSPATVKRDWQVTRLWLFRRLSGGEA
jgi:RNA polymerase sigma factor (TIGR02999 family)